MKAIYLLIPLSLMLLSLAIWAFFWAVKNDQFEDLDTPAMDILDDDEPVQPASIASDQQPHKKPQLNQSAGDASDSNTS